MNGQSEKTEQINEHLSLTSMTDGLTFGTDAYLLSAYVRRRARGRAVDLGSGTGVIALLCAQRGAFAHIHAVELQRAVLLGDYSGIFPHIWYVLGYGIVLLALAVFLFLRQMKKQ